MEKIAVLMPNWIGDFLIALAIIRRKLEKEAIRVTLLIPEPCQGLSCLFKDLHSIPYKRKTAEDLRATIASVKQEQFDRLLVLPRSFSSAFSAWKTGVPVRKGLTGELRSAFLTHHLPRSLESRDKHLINEYAQVLETDPFEPQTWEPTITGFQNEYANATVFCPGAFYGPAKQWNGFAGLAELLQDKNIVIVGDKRDYQYGRAIADRLPYVKNLAGQTTLGEAVSIIATARAVVSNDSGLMHVAGYTGAPVIGVFGSTAPAWTRPLGEKVRIANQQISCSPCFKRTCRFGTYACLRQITPEMVLSLVQELECRPGVI